MVLKFRGSPVLQRLKERLGLKLGSLAVNPCTGITARLDRIVRGCAMLVPDWPRAWRRAQPGQIVGPRHARPQTGAARGSGPAASGEFDRACARLPMKWQVGAEEQVL